MAVIFHSTNCPKCKVLKLKLDKKNIEYETNSDIEVMKAKGLSSAPCLEIDSVIVDFVGANKLINEFDNSTPFEDFAKSKLQEN